MAVGFDVKDARFAEVQEAYAGGKAGPEVYAKLAQLLREKWPGEAERASLFFEQPREFSERYVSDLIAMCERQSFRDVGKLLGISGRAVKRRLDKFKKEKQGGKA